eukprot:PhM_4_TR7607/c1_g1_i1/m.55969/K01103/PFKFB3; 6-phosphofructo-2-kinase / fructose-2,6-biphosphatase 3&\
MTTRIPAALQDPVLTFSVPRSESGPDFASREGVPFPRNPIRDQQMVLIFVGLPGRGKTHTAHKLTRYTNWLGIQAKCFFVGEYLRCMFRPSVDPTMTTSANIDIASPSPPKRASSGRSPLASPLQPDRAPFTDVEREEAVTAALDDVQDFLTNGGQVALLDGRAASAEKRRHIVNRIESFELPVSIVFIEVQKEDSKAEEVYRMEYRTIASTRGQFDNEEEAVRDFLHRVATYKEEYTPVTKSEGDYIKISDGKTFEVHGIRGFLPSRLVGWTLNLSVENQLRHPIFFCRHGESEYNLEDRVGGNPNLTYEGRKDAAALADYIVKEGYTPETLSVWTSRLVRTIQTAQPLEDRGFLMTRWRELNEIHAGICEDLTYEEIAAKYPTIKQWRSQQKYTFRYPGGESYQDLVHRLEPVIMELESARTPVLVVAHQAVLRALFAYFFNAAAQESVSMDVPHATVWKVVGAGSPSAKIERTTLRVREKRASDSFAGPPCS